MWIPKITWEKMHFLRPYNSTNRLFQKHVRVKYYRSNTRESSITQLSSSQASFRKGSIVTDENISFDISVHRRAAAKLNLA